MDIKYGIVIKKPELYLSFIDSPTAPLLQRIKWKITSTIEWMKEPFYMAISFTLFKYALLGHF